MLAVPEKVDVPLKVTWPAVAVNVPGTLKLDEMSRSLAVDKEPVISTPASWMVELPEMVFPDPENVMLPADADSGPLTVRSPAMVRVLEVDMLPVLMIRLLRVIFAPEMVLEVPVVVILPVPPAVCTKLPPLAVEKFPQRDKDEF